MYRIGELAEKANISKRTVDYYTTLGLLKAKRSPSNYRYYTEEALCELKFIEECKKLHFSLEEIKRKLELKRNKQVEKEEILQQANMIANHLNQLNQELSDIMPVIERLNEDDRKSLSHKLSIQGETLMKSLQVFLV